MVARVDQFMAGAIEPRQGPLDERLTVFRLAPGDAGEFVRAPGGEGSRNMFLVFGEDVV